MGKKIIFVVDRGRYIKSNSLVVLKNTGSHFYVRAETVEKWYSVTYDSRMRSFSCSCEDHMRRRLICKHIIAVIRQHAANISLELAAEEPEPVTN